MADINVERRKPSLWPWLVGLVVLALLVYAVAGMLGDDGATPGDARPAQEEIMAPEQSGELPPAPEVPTERR